MKYLLSSIFFSLLVFSGLGIQVASADNFLCRTFDKQHTDALNALSRATFELEQKYNAYKAIPYGSVQRKDAAYADYSRSYENYQRVHREYQKVVNSLNSICKRGINGIPEKPKQRR